MTMKPWETDPANYDALFAAKANAIEARFGDLGAPVAQRFASPSSGYRVRAEFRLWHDGDELDYVMFDPAAPRDPVAVTHFAPALASIQSMMAALRPRLRDEPLLRRKLFQVEFMGSSEDDLLVTLIYHRPLDEDWEAKARELAADLSIAIVGRSRKQKIVVGRDYIHDRFTVAGRTYRYRQYEQSFVQPNGPVNERMLNWAHTQCTGATGDLLELYCGNGNFTLPLADCFEHVIATELSKSGTRAAQENLRDNEVDNVQVIRLSAEEVSQALDNVRPFRRLAVLPRPLQDYALKTVFVDPPRAGLDDLTLRCVQRFERILYISCNPETLLANLRALAPDYAIAALAFFDQFPYTPHLETGVLLERRRG